MAFSIENFSITDGNTLKATADVALGDGIYIYGVKLVRKSDNKFFMAMPSKKVGDQYRDDAAIKNAALRRAVEASLIAKYKACKSIKE